MITREISSLGGVVTAKIRRTKAIDLYYGNPKKCLYCDEIIHVGGNKVSEIKRKKFCDHSCAVKYYNAKRPQKPPKVIVKKEKVRPYSYLDNTTKGELAKRRSNWQSWRTSVRNHASAVYKEKTHNKGCENCGYDKHIQICHIKSVSEFDDGALIKDINSKDNLIGLCPNCHWEFDHGILNIGDLV